jgi:hypothetical protein
MMKKEREAAWAQVEGLKVREENRIEGTRGAVAAPT